MNNKWTAISQTPYTILFVCNMNSVRSPLAEAILNKYVPTLKAASAGLTHGRQDAFLATLLKEKQLERAQNYETQTLDDIEMHSFQLIIALTPQAYEALRQRQRDHTIPLEYWPTPDPTLACGTREQILNAYRATYDQLKQKIIARFT